jgi:hypothetical protein
MITDGEANVSPNPWAWVSGRNILDIYKGVAVRHLPKSP